MRIPFWLVIFLPKTVQDKSMQGRWDDKSDADIIHAFKDNHDWGRTWNGMSKPHNGVVLNAIEKNRERYDTYIEPQMKRRGLTVAPPLTKYGYIMDEPK